MLRDEFVGTGGSKGQEMASSDGHPVVTSLLCANALLRAGLTQILVGTRFTVADPGRPQEDPSSSLYIVDAGGPAEQTLGFIQMAKGQNPAACIVAIANSFDPDSIRPAISAGVDSFCLATGEREVLIKTLDLTMLGEKVFPPAVLDALLSPIATATIHRAATGSERKDPDPQARQLSPREKVILHALMGGEANKAIARKLDVAEATIKVHVKSILRKIGAANRTQAAMWASENLPKINSPSLQS